MKRGRNLPRMLVKREKQKRALELGRAGLSYEEIAREMGYASKACIHKLIHGALRDIPAQAAEDYRMVEDQRIEALMTTYMPKAMEGDLDAAKMVDALIGRRAKLMGINAPERAPVNERNETVGDLNGFDAVAVLASRIARIADKRGPGGGAGGADS